MDARLKQAPFLVKCKKLRAVRDYCLLVLSREWGIEPRGPVYRGHSLIPY